MNNPQDRTKNKLISAAFLTCVAGSSIIFGFGMALAMAKKRDPKFFTQGLTHKEQETGGSLALRALGWGTAYAVTGFSGFCYGVWKILGVKDMEEFRNKMGSILPSIPKKEPQGRSDFSSVRELVNYLTEEGKK